MILHKKDSIPIFLGYNAFATENPFSGTNYLDLV